MRSVVAAMSAVIALSAVASEKALEIEPFGPFSWRTGLFDVIEAAKSIDPGAKLIWQDQETPISGISSPSDLSNALHDMLRQTYPIMFDESANKHRYSYMLQTYVGHDGTEQTYLQSASMSLALTDSIHLAGVPFSLQARLSLVPGFAVVAPESVLIDSSGRFAFPLVLTQVSLGSRSPLLDDRRPQINKLLWDKYGHLSLDAFINDDHSRFDGSMVDDNANSLTVESKRGQGTYIHYSSGFQSELADAYRAFLAAQEAKATAGAADLSSEL